MRRLPLLLCSIGMFAYAGYVSTATITVTTTEPGINADGLCSFAEAIENANGGEVHADCSAGESGYDFVHLGREMTYVLYEEYEPESGFGLPTITSSVMINGRGSVIEGRSGLGLLPVDLDPESSAILHRLTFRLAEVGVSASGDLILSSCTFTENRTALDFWGPTLKAIDSEFTLNFNGVVTNYNSANLRYLSITGCNFEGNYAALLLLGHPYSTTVRACNIVENYGGIRTDGHHVEVGDSHIDFNSGDGIYADNIDVQGSVVFGNGGAGISGVELRIVGSTVSNNQGGGVIARGSNYQYERGLISNSTIGGNVYGDIVVFGNYGGYSVGSLDIVDSTVYSNSNSFGAIYFNVAYGAPPPSPIVAYAPTVTLSNTILTGRFLPLGCKVRTPQNVTIETDIISAGFNLAHDRTCNLHHTTDMIVGDSMLSELGDWGGSTPVHMPLEGSPAIDMGSEECIPLDQRGFMRPADGDGDGVAYCDCGAVEYGAEPPPRPFDPRVTASEVE